MILWMPTRIADLEGVSMVSSMLEVTISHHVYPALHSRVWLIKWNSVKHASNAGMLE